MLVLSPRMYKEQVQPLFFEQLFIAKQASIPLTAKACDTIGNR